MQTQTIDQSFASVIRSDGIFVYPELFEGVHLFVDYLAGCPVYPNHARQGRDAAPFGSLPWMCYDMQDVILAPGWFEKAVELLPIASAYLEVKPYLYSMNAFYTAPASFTKRDIQEFHRDTDDSRFVVLFLYCTDVFIDAEGAHQFQLKSHRCDVDDPETKTVLGSAGTMFFSDTRGLHRGLVPRNRRRMIAWARYGVSNPPAAYIWDELTPVDKTLLGARYPSDPELQEAVKLVVS
jgi:hypothetical protein